MFDGKAFGQEMVEIVKGHVARAVEPLLKRIDALEAELAEAKAFDPSGAIEAAVSKAFDAMPKPKDGEPGKDAEPIDPEAVKAMVAEIVEPAIAALPVPQDGKSVTVADVEPLIASCVSSAVSEAVKAIPVPKDGKDGLDAVTPILKDGVLLFTMSDGSVKEVGPIVGKDGEDGAPGKDGRDGFGFEDLEVVHDGERGFTFRFARGETVKEFPFTLPVVIDRGVWKEGETYGPGDGVTWAGSFWIAQKETSDKPDGGDGWRLSVKRGRDGKPGRDGELKAKQPVKVG